MNVSVWCSLVSYLVHKLHEFKLPSQLRLYNTPTASLQRDTPRAMSVLDMTLKKSEDEFPVILELLGNAEYPFIAIAPRSTQARNGSIW